MARASGAQASLCAPSFRERSDQHRPQADAAGYRYRVATFLLDTAMPTRLEVVFDRAHARQ